MSHPQPADRPPPPKRTPGISPSAAKPAAARPAPSKAPAEPAAETSPGFVVSDFAKQQATKKQSSANGSKNKKGPKSPWLMIAGSAAGAILGAIVLIVLMNALKKPPETPRPRVTKQIKRQALPPREVKPIEK